MNKYGLKKTSLKREQQYLPVADIITAHLSQISHWADKMQKKSSVFSVSESERQSDNWSKICKDKNN